ncbi:addiction module protein [Flagellimonas sp. CMM7]|uniref:addiction module protein n=1 Tax=Flagellimonas sp. CMM7 TaxID=2654676 RepID=UPI0013D41A57|nr:addiction module protein [Flagellimonas sp. CMM7]UII79556.1 addiction module protein [Flagellimonas sp. CMM7]
MDQGEENIELTDEIKAELDRRLERHKTGEAKYFTLEEAKALWAKKRNQKE